ncbi:MAG: protein kinase [Nannocystaceae bacterium]
MGAVGEATRLGRYRLGERVGAGGLAEVYLAHAEGAKGFRKRVVVKRLRSERVGDPQAAASLLAEARLVAGLTHIGIVQVLDLGLDDDAPYVVMEHVDGVTLHDLEADAEARGAPLDAGVLRRITRSIADALDHAHHAVDDDGRPLAIVHGDVTPSNILVGRDAQVKLTDFGIAWTRGEGGRGVGTPGYRAPEQEAGATIDARADVHGLGVVLRELAAALPADDRSRAPLLEIADGAAASSPDDRPPSARALAEALDALTIDDAGARDDLAARVRAIQDARRSNASRLGAALDGRDLGPRTVMAGPAGRARGRRSLLAGGALLALAAGIAAASTLGADEAAIAGPRSPTATTEPTRASSSADADVDPARPAEASPLRGPTRSSDPSRTDAAPPSSEGSPDDPPRNDPEEPDDPSTPATTASPRGSSSPPRTRRAAIPGARATTSPGRLRVNLLPFAEVRVDDRELGRTPIDRPIDPGPHTLVLENPQSGLRRARTIDVAPGGEVVISEW